MSEKLGPVAYGEGGGDVFLGRDLQARKDYSESKAREIDEEIQSMLNDMYAESKQLLVENREVLAAMATALLERETLETKDLERLIQGEELPPLPSPLVPDDPEPAPESPAPTSEETEEFPASGSKLPDPEPMPS